MPLLFLCALILSGCAHRAASASSEQAAFDTSHPMQVPGAPEMEKSAREERDYDGGALNASAPSTSRAKSAPNGGETGGPEGAGLGAVEPAAAVTDPFVDETSEKARRPLLIYHAELGLGVFRVQENLDKIEKMTLDVGGYLVTRGEQRITVRVPAKDFESTVDAVLDLGDVHRREIVAQDITAEYLDIQIRLKNALAVRHRLEELLQKAQDVKEALKVEEQLGRVTEQIEVMKGRLKYLREVTSFSTISVEFAERSAPVDARVELPFEWLRELGLNSLLSL